MGALDRRPVVHATDNRFVRDLKRSIIQIYERLDRQRLSGDSRTFRVTQGPSGYVGHAMGKTHIAAITVDNADGSYEGQDQVWDDDVEDWVADTAGRTYDDTDFPFLWAADGSTGIDVGTIVEVLEVVGDEGVTNFVFVPAGSPPSGYGYVPDGTEDYQTLVWDDTTDTAWEASSLFKIDFDNARVLVMDDTNTYGMTLETDASGHGYIEADTGASGDLHLQYNAEGNIECFADATNGQTKAFRIYGFRNLDSLRYLDISVGSDAANSVSFDLDGRNLFFVSNAGNTFVGDIAGTLSTASSATFIGDASGWFSSGANVTGIGVNACRQNNQDGTTGVGKDSCYSNTGMRVTGLGTGSAFQNTGDDINAFGNLSCYQNTGDRVVAYGPGACQSNIGSSVTAVGYHAAQQTGGAGGGSRCIFIGGEQGLNNSTNDLFTLGDTASNATPLLTGDLANNYLHFKSDSHRLYFGAGDDAYWHYDGTKYQCVAVSGDDDLYLTDFAVVIQAPDNTSATDALYIEDSSASELFSVRCDGLVTISGAYSLPTADAAGANYVLKNDGDTTTSWAAVGSLLTAGNLIDITGNTIDVDLTEVTSYNADNVQALANNASTIQFMETIDLEDALALITGFGASKALTTDGSSNIGWT